MIRTRVAGLFAAACLILSAGVLHAAPVPAEVDLTAVRTIQLASLDSKTDDQIYLLVSGIAAGKDVQSRLPADKTLTGSPKKPAVTEKSPFNVWKGELDNGEFALITVTLMMGDGTDTAQVKQYLDKLAAADKLTPQWSGKTLAKADVPKFCTGLIKNQQAVVTKIKDIFSREAKTDHYGGQFNVLVWNDNGKISKRLDPIGLTFGEHFGIDLKIYSKLKATRVNALMQDDGGQWTQQQLLPLDDAETTIRVKMLETEPQPTDKTTKHVTDYITEIQVKDAGGKPLGWTLEGENTGYDVVHTYYDFAD
jgi:hypothetical protein